MGTAPEPSFADRVAAVVVSIEAGTVLTYGEVAAAAGSPGAARAVGHVLAARGRELPWWRVVTARGRLAPGLEREQAWRLDAEGVPCGDGVVDRRAVVEQPSSREPEHPA